MNVNGVTSQSASSYDYTPGVKEHTAAETAPAAKAEESGVVYEPSKESPTASTKKTYKPDTKLVNQLKSDAEARTSQLKSLVEKLMTKQATAYGNANDIWSVLRSGNFTVDPATKAQAQEDISENGYWGVKQTSQRILDFANALTGGDPSKLQSMRDAFEKGFKMAEKTWGGKLPEISQQTYKAVMDGFDKMADEAGVTFKN